MANGRARLALQIAAPDDLAAAETTIRRASYKKTDAKLARFKQTFVAPEDAQRLPAAHRGRLGDRANDGVQAGAIAPAGDNADAFHGVFGPCGPFSYFFTAVPSSSCTPTPSSVIEAP